MTELCIVAARRTVQGRFLGKLKDVSPVELACAAARPMLQSLPTLSIDQVIVGNVLGAGQGMNVARQIGIGLGLDPAIPAYTVNMMCGSGLQTIRLAAAAIQTGDARVVLCGGTESMSSAPYLLPRARQGLKLGDATLVDSILRDGLTDVFDGRHMGLLAEDLATSHHVTRAEQDAWAVRSQQRHHAAQQAGAFQHELVAVNGLEADEHPRPTTCLDDLSRLKASFSASGTITAGNASGINDGAALVILADRALAVQNGWPILCDWIDAVTVGCEPRLMGLGPVHALNQLTRRCGIALADCDLIEINEAFAAQTLACLKDLSLDESRVNRCGGAIAMGHPIGASGARLVVHAAHQLHQHKATQAAVSLCVGGGMGTAALLRACESPS